VTGAREHGSNLVAGCGGGRAAVRPPGPLDPVRLIRITGRVAGTNCGRVARIGLDLPLGRSVSDGARTGMSCHRATGSDSDTFTVSSRASSYSGFKLTPRRDVPRTRTVPGARSRLRVVQGRRT
jgi:hypothetical protein